MKTRERKPRGFWNTKFNCLVEARKYRTRFELQDRSQSCYTSCLSKGWLDDVCKHMATPKRKPKDHWNIKSNCFIEARKFKALSEFRIKSGGCYNSCLKNGWVGSICKHMENVKKPNGYWDSKSNCAVEANKCKTRTEFQTEHPSCYTYCIKNGWLDDVCKHMVRQGKPIYWTFEKCQDAALKCKSRSEFSKKFNVAYVTAHKNGWLSSICKHLDPKYESYDFKMVRDIAFGFETRRDFFRKFRGAYRAAHRNGWLDRVCKHMKVLGNRGNRCVYAYEFQDNHVYVGLTYDTKQRDKQHKTANKRKTAVYLHSEKTGLAPVLKKLTRYLPVKKAQKKEDFWQNWYKKEGWMPLHKAKPGGVGGSHIIYTYELCLKEALKYKSKSEFEFGSKPQYRAAGRNKWMKQICSHMIPEKRGSWNKKWTHEKCKELSLECKTKKEFREKFPGASSAAMKNKWMPSICEHMKIVKRPNGYWTFEKCEGDALNYNCRRDFEYGGGGGYGAARKRGWLDEICSHMVPNRTLPAEIMATKGSLTKKFNSIANAARQMKMNNISKVLTGELKHIRGWNFEYL